MHGDLSGRVALVTGASRGIGKGIALALARAGCRLAICARGAAELQRAGDEIEHAARQTWAGSEAGATVAPIVCDLVRRESAADFVAEAARAFGPADILVNNIGGSRRKPFDATTDADWDDMLELNLLAGLRTARAAIPAMKTRRRGSILFISSIWGREAGQADSSLYVTTKAAVNAASKMMARDLAPFGIRVNTLAPGSIRFPGGSWERRTQEDPQAIREFVDRSMPLGRFGTVEEVASAAAFLVSDQAGLITGACLPVDGGQGWSF